MLTEKIGWIGVGFRCGTLVLCSIVSTPSNSFTSKNEYLLSSDTQSDFFFSVLLSV